MPENPSTAPASVSKPPKVSVTNRPTTPTATQPETKEQNRPTRKYVRASTTGFFVSLDDAEKLRAEMEEEKQKQINARRQASANFEAFDIDFGGNARRETFDVPPKLNVTRNLNDGNKENISRGLFPHDISGISVGEDSVLKNKLKSRTDNLTSTPLQRHT